MLSTLLALQLTVGMTPGQTLHATCAGPLSVHQTSRELFVECADGTPPPVALCDSNLGENQLIVHPEPLPSGVTWEGAIQIDDRPGQSYVGCGGVLDHMELRLNHDTLTDGVLKVRIYAHAEVYGVSSAPVGAAAPSTTPTAGWLAESEPLLLTRANMPNGTRWYSLPFVGTNRIAQPESGRFIAIVDWQPTTRDRHNTLGVHADTLKRHAGNVYNDGGGAQIPGVDQRFDLTFAIYEEQ